jgi:hypothetical protein
MDGHEIESTKLQRWTCLVFTRSRGNPSNVPIIPAAKPDRKVNHKIEWHRVKNGKEYDDIAENDTNLRWLLLRDGTSSAQLRWKRLIVMAALRLVSRTGFDRYLLRLLSARMMSDDVCTAFVAGDDKSAKKNVPAARLNRNRFNNKSINVDIERRDDGNVSIARELYDALRAKISWGLRTP